MKGQEYIVNLAEQIVGKALLEELEKKHVVCLEATTDPCELFDELYPQVKAKVKKMNPRTLGLICTHAIDDNVCTGFRYENRSGFMRVATLSRTHLDNFDCHLSGRELIEEIAVATIISVAYDIIHQNIWDIERIDDQVKHAYEMYDRQK